MNEFGDNSAHRLNVNLEQAEAEFDELIAHVEAGSVVIFWRSSNPVAQLVPYDGERHVVD